MRLNSYRWALICLLFCTLPFLIPTPLAFSQTNVANPRNTRIQQPRTNTRRQAGATQRRKAGQKKTNSRSKKAKKAVVRYPSIKHIMQAKSLHGWSMKYEDSYKRTREMAYLQNAAKYSKDSIEKLKEVQANLKSVNPEFHRARKLRLQYCQFYHTLYLESKVWGAMVEVNPLPDSYCINP